MTPPSDQDQTLSLRSRLGHDAWTVPAMLHARAARSANGPALWSPDGAEGKWRPRSWGDYRDRAAALAAGLRHLGLLAGERVGIMAQTCEHWDLLQMGILAAGGVVVGMDPNDLDDNLDAVARRCQLAGLIVADVTGAGRFSPAVRDRLRFLVRLDPSPGLERGIAYDDLYRLGEASPKGSWHRAQPDDPATIIFTSGTTGAPKGIQYTHRQICLAVASILDAFPDLDEPSRLACWLPLSNMFQRVINTLAIACGSQTYYVEDPRTILRQVRHIRPHLFIGVPRFYEKLYAGMMDRIGQGPKWQHTLAAWALRVGDSHASAVRGSRRPRARMQAHHWLADRLVLRRLRAVMGPDLRYMVSGSAPMPLWLLERYHAMGLLILEAYGLSENVIPIAANRLNAYRFGTVGRPLRGCEVRVAEDGELMVRGPGVIRAYYGEEQTELLDSDGYLATGDFAVIDPDGFVTLTGRKSEIFKTATGRRIAPAAIEGLLLQVPDVEHAVVFGASRPFLVAVVVASPRGMAGKEWSAAGPQHLLAYCEGLRAQLARHLEPLPAYQRPAGLVVTTRPLSVADGDLTMNLKLRRPGIAARYAAELDALYRRLAEPPGNGLLEFTQGKELDTVLCSL